MRPVAAHPWLSLLVAGTAAGYALYSVLRHWHFQSSAYDLGIFDQAIWHYSRFERPVNTISGYPHILAEHFHPILMLLAPLYWLLPRPETLLIAQAVLLALSAIPVYHFARRRLDERPALLMTASYCVYWGLQKTAAFDFHELAFAPLLVATAIWALDRGRWLPFWSASLALLLVKEDMAPFVAFVGAFLLLRRHWVHGVAAIVVGLGSFGLIVGWIMPGLSAGGTYAFGGAFAHLGGAAALARPWLLVALLFTPLAKARTILLWLGPFMFLPLISPYGMLVVPIAVTRLLSSAEGHWAAQYHYTAPLSPVLAMAASDGLGRLLSWIGSAKIRRQVLVAAITMVLAMCAILPGKLPLWRLLQPRWYASTESERTGYEALRLIPAAASVMAQDAIVPHLSRRHQIFALRAGKPQTEYVIASRGLSPWPHAGWDEIDRLLDEKRLAGYRTAFERDGWVVLVQPGH